MIKVGCQVRSKLCSCAKTYTKEQQDTDKLCTNTSCGHKMASHNEKIAQPSHYDNMNSGCNGKVINGILIPCSCAKTYTQEQQNSDKLCNNTRCGHKMACHTEKIAQQSHYDRTGMKITILIYLLF